MVDVLPTVNALLNAMSAVCIVAGFVAVRRGDRVLHKTLMLFAVGLSTLFLISYLTRYALSGAHRFPDVGAVRWLYLVILFTHMILAAALVPLVLRSLYLGLTGSFEAHKRWVRWAWPIWVIVSLTGIVVYLMLYHLAPRIT